jgi:hypothetical protein
MKNVKTLEGDRVIVFKYPRGLMSELFKGKQDVGVVFNPRTVEWGYIANVGWGHMRWFSIESRTFREQERGQTFQIDFTFIKEPSHTTVVNSVE